MSARELVAQLRAWGGEAAWWQLRAASDYERGLDGVLLVAIVSGYVEVEPQPEPDEDIVRLRC